MIGVPAFELDALDHMLLANGANFFIRSQCDCLQAFVDICYENFVFEKVKEVHEHALQGDEG
jgi:hypothetical protein